MIDLENYNNSHIEEVINEWIHSERDREVLKYRLIHGYTYSQLADKFYPLSERQIKNIIYKAERILFKHL